LLTAARGIAVSLILTGAHRHDMTELAALLDGTVVEPAPREPPHLALDRGYDYASCRAEGVDRGYTVHIPPPAAAERPIPPGHPDRHPPRRWVVEVAHSWFNRFRRLLTRTEKLVRHYLGFCHVAAVLIVYRKVRHARALSG
jgi:transposase